MTSTQWESRGRDSKDMKTPDVKPAGATLNLLTLDIEDWRQLIRLKFTGEVCSPGREVVDETNALLQALADRNVHATFFVLANVAVTFPELVRLIHQQGHEIASHGYSHERIYRQKPEQFRAETRKAKSLLEDIAGAQVLGYRAAEFSITAQSWWALDVLSEEGFAYDSSVFPIAGRRYGVPNAQLAPHRIHTRSGNTLWEFPLTAVELWKYRLPVGGGGYFRLTPYGLTRLALEHVNQQGRSAVVYLHPYEFTEEKLEIALPKLSLRQRLILARYSRLHNLGRKRLCARFRKLLVEFRFLSVRDWLLKKGDSQ